MKTEIEPEDKKIFCKNCGGTGIKYGELCHECTEYQKELDEIDKPKPEENQEEMTDEQKSIIRWLWFGTFIWWGMELFN